MSKDGGIGLLLIDDNDRQSLEESPHRDIWLLAHVYASFESSIVLIRLDHSMTTIVSHVLKFGKLYFDYLWQNLRQSYSGFKRTHFFPNIIH